MATEKARYSATMDKKDLPPSSFAKVSPPPSYTQTSVDDISNRANLRLESASSHPTVDQCIAHLKLLEAFHQLREDIATSDGLFGISDELSTESSKPEEALAKVREKRWAVYVARAADRFETWWNTCVPSSQRRLRQSDVTSTGDFPRTPDIGRPMKLSNTPPLGRSFAFP